MTNFGRRKILDVISEITAHECRKVGVFLPKKTVGRLSIDIVEKAQKFWEKLISEHKRVGFCYPDK